MKQQRVVWAAAVATVLGAGLAACGDVGVESTTQEDAGVSAPVVSSAPQTPTPTPSSIPDAAPTQPERVLIEEDRELRGVWVASVYGLDFPGTPKPPAEAVARLAAIVDAAANAGLNALFFHVRPESDALYHSNLEPWSRYLTGEQGKDPGYDPLATLLELAHARGLEVHAWVNPYRGIANKNTPVAEGHVTRAIPAAAIPYGEAVLMDPGHPEVRSWILSVVDDLLDHYAVDGLHYDDYFYPYPDGQNTQFADGPSYATYQQGGGTLPKKEWRIENVNAMVRETGALIAEQHPTVRFGISPFGIYRPDPSLGITGLDAYDVLACDAPRWLAEGWIDYLTPQLYWPTTLAARPFGTLANFWAGKLAGETQLYFGHALYQVGSGVTWPFEELVSQVAIGRGMRASGLGAVGGGIFFSYSSLEKAGMLDAFRTRLFPGPALTPTLPRAARTLGIVPAPEVAQIAAERLTLSAPSVAPEFYALYTQSSGGGRWQLARVLGGDSVEIPLGDAPVYALSAVGQGGVESLATVLRR